jgi:DNA-binding transcriptional ArsR family regulator
VLDSYYSFDKEAYYHALHETQGANYAHAAAANLDPWIDYFAQGFLVSANVLAAEVAILSGTINDVVPAKISSDEADLLSYVEQFGSLSISEAEEILRGVPRRTVQRKLRKLVNNGLLALSGTARSAVYTLNSTK